MTLFFFLSVVIESSVESASSGADVSPLDIDLDSSAGNSKNKKKNKNKSSGDFLIICPFFVNYL